MRDLRTFLAAILVFASFLGAQTTKPIDLALPMIESRVTELEADIGRLMQKRADASNQAQGLELRIDARLVARWLLARAAAAEGDARHIAWIRANDALDAIALVEKDLDSGVKAADAPSAAIKALNDLTFKLPDPKSSDQSDAICKTTAGAIAPAGNWPIMRPAVKAEVVGGRSFDDLADRAKGLNVSPALRSQVLAVSQKAQEIQKDPKRQGELPVIREMLDNAITLAEGLQVNTAVEREDRVQMEAQIAQGLAMTLDPRTRELGQRRIASLSVYRELVLLVRGKKLSPELMKRFGPAMTWAQKNPADSGELMKALELFLEQDGRLADLPAKAELTGLYAKAAEDARRRAVAARQGFIDAMTTSTTFHRATTIKRQAEAFQRALDGRAAIMRMSEVMKTINALRPKPFGGIDKRVQSALATWQPDTREPDRDAATQLLTGLAKLADMAAEPADASAISGKYTGGSMDTFRAKRKAALSEVVNAIAGGAAVDDMTFAPIHVASELVASARLGMRAEDAAANAEITARWVDWGVKAESVTALLDPYRSAMSAAFKGFAESDQYQLGEWEKARKRYEPALTFIVRIADKTEECRTMPAGRAGAAAKLATPMVGQPFAGERATRFELDVWLNAWKAKDDKQANAALDRIGVLLAK